MTLMDKILANQGLRPISSALSGKISEAVAAWSHSLMARLRTACVGKFPAREMVALRLPRQRHRPGGPTTAVQPSGIAGLPS